MSLHRTKATIIGLLEAGRVNEWIVTEKLGDALKGKASGKAPRKPRFRIGERYTFLILPLTCYEIWSSLHFKLTLLSIKDDIWATFLISVLNFDRLHLLELGVGAYLFFCGCYDVFFGKNHFFIFLYIQAIAFFIMGFGYVGTFVPNSWGTPVSRNDSEVLSAILFPWFLLQQHIMSHHSDKYRAMKACEKNKDVWSFFLGWALYFQSQSGKS